VLVVGTRLAVPPAASVASAVSSRFLSSDPRVRAAARGPVDGSRDDLCYLTPADAPAVALTFGARGGIYIAGGISPRISDFLIRSEFRSRFEAKGRFQPYLEAVPSYVITHPAAAFVGLKSFADYRSSY
jgi:glucokinase